MTVREVRTRDLHRRGLREIRREHRGRRNRVMIVGRHEREIRRAGLLDPAREPTRDEPLGRGDAHGWIPTSGSAVVSGRPSRRFAAWTICPAAPFTRLSSAAIATTVSVRASKRTVTCATLAPYVALVPDGSSTTNTHRSFA